MRTLGPALTAICLLAAVVGSAGAQNRFEFSVEPWVGSAYFGQESNAFSHCMMAAQFDRQMSLVVALDRAGGVSLGVRNPRWTLAVLEEQTMGFALGGNRVYEQTATAVDSSLLLAHFSQGDAILSELAHASTVSVDQGEQSFQFVIVNGPEAIDALKDCSIAARIGVDVLPAATQPVDLGSSPDANGNGTAGSPDQRTVLVDPIALDQTVARSFLAAAGLDDFVLMTPDELDAFLSEARAAWTDGTVFGALYTIAPRVRRLDRAIDRVLQVYTDGCVGAYVVSPLPETDTGATIQRRAASCDEDEVGMLFRVTAINGETGTLVIVHAGLREEAARLSDIDDRLIEAIRRGQIAVE